MSEWSLTPPGEVHEVDTAESDYHKFRSGRTFADVRQELDLEAQSVFAREGRRMFITRATILGRLHQHKQTAWRGRHKRWQLDDYHVPEYDYPKGSSWKLGDPF